MRVAVRRKASVTSVSDQLPLFGLPIDEQASENSGDERADLLDAVTRASRVRRRAGEGFDSAVSRARQDGCSWRAIARAAGLPHQTLHRRYGVAEEPISEAF